MEKIKKLLPPVTCHLSLRNGFTLVELMVVIAIIGIMASVVTVSMKGSVDRSKKASALTTASSVLPELVTCADDGYEANTPSGGTQICNCSSCGHSANWPDVVSKTGWDYGTGTYAPSGTLANGDYVFYLVKTGEAEIECSLADNGCE